MEIREQILTAKKGYAEALKSLREKAAAPPPITLPNSLPPMLMPPPPLARSSSSSSTALSCEPPVGTPPAATNAPPSREMLTLAISHAAEAATAAARAVSHEVLDQELIDQTSAAAAAAAVDALALLREDEIEGARQLFEGPLSSTSSSTGSSLCVLREERMALRTEVEAMPGLMQTFEAVGTYFNEKGVLEHTCTHSFLSAVRLAITKAKHLEHPEGVERHQVVGTDSRNFDVLRKVDGTSYQENRFGELNPTLTLNLCSTLTLTLTSHKSPSPSPYLGTLTPTLTLTLTL